MIVYQSSKSGFLHAVFTKDIEEVILSAFKARTGRAVSAAEVRSWKESLLAVAKVLNDDAIPGECGVAIEYGVPQTAKRIDRILSGAEAAQREQLIIIELKQWASARKADRDGHLAAGEFDFQVFDSPEALRRVIVEKNHSSNKARMVAGYCWDRKSRKNSEARDVVIPEYGFAMRWNLNVRSRIAGAADERYLPKVAESGANYGSKPLDPG